MAYNNFKATIWSKHVQHELDKLMVFKEICNTNFQGEVGRGKTVKIIGATKPTVKNYVPGTALATPETPTETSVSLTINQYRYTNFMVEDVDAAQTDIDIMKHLMKGASSALAESADTYIATLLKDSRNIMASQQIDTPEKAKKAVDDAFVFLWEKGVKTGKDTYIVVTPWFYSLFKNSLTEVLSNNVDMVENGVFGMYNGCPVKMSNNIYNDGTDDFIAVMTKDAVVFAQGIEEVNAYRPNDSFSDAVKILHTFGAKVVHPEQMIAMKVHQ